MSPLLLVLLVAQADPRPTPPGPAPARPAAQPADALAECRRLDQSFDTRGMAAPCTAATSDSARPAADRADAARLLAFALFTNGDVAGAETAFVRMLAVVPTATPGDGASPRLQEVFGRARARFDANVVVVTANASAAPAGAGPPDAGAPTQVAFSADVVDELARVTQVRAALTAAGSEVSSASLTSTAPGRWTGMAPAPTLVADGCRVDALGADGVVVASGACVAPATAAAAEDGPPWLVIAAGAGAAVVVGTVVVVAWAVAGNRAPAAVTVVIQ